MATIVDGNRLICGPPGDQWHYLRNERTFDLTRAGEDDNGSSDRDDVLVVRTTAGAPDTSLALAPARTALVIVDMQNYFLHPRCRAHPSGLAAVEPTRRLIADCRAVGVQIIWLNWGLTDADLAAMPAAIVRGFAKSMYAAGSDSGDPAAAGLGVDMDKGRGRALVAGEWNSAVYEGGGEGCQNQRGLADQVRPDLGDLQCAKDRMSGLWSTTTSLWTALAASKPAIRTLLFTGVNTDQCVLGTLTDAYNAGWDCVAVADCCATGTPHGQETTLWNTSNSYGFVIDSNTFAQGTQAFLDGQRSN